MSLQGKVALVTGGGKNLGAQSARELAREGANLALHYNSPKSKDETLRFRDELKGQYNALQVSIHAGDLTTASAVEQLFKDVLAEHRKIDIVVNTVGMVLKKPITEITEAEYDKMFAYAVFVDQQRSKVNSKAAFFILKEGAKHVEDGGKIVTIVTSLLAAFTGFYTSYAGSKAPVEHFTRGVAKELQARRVSVNAIAPGPMDTPFFYPQEGDDAVAFHKSMAMEGRLTDIKDIAPIVRFLCTEGYWMTGQTIFPNGGYTTR